MLSLSTTVSEPVVASLPTGNGRVRRACECGWQNACAVGVWGVWCVMRVGWGGCVGRGCAVARVWGVGRVGGQCGA